jgi:hypothetical protein
VEPAFTEVHLFLQGERDTKVHHACALRALENQGFSRYQCSSKDEYWYEAEK